MIMEGAGTCPLIKIGDLLTRGNCIEVDSLHYNESKTSTCNAFKCVAAVKIHIPNGYFGPFYSWTDPANEVDCNLCPVLKEDPGHKRHTPTHEEVRALQQALQGLMHRRLLTPSRDEEEQIPVPEVKEIDRFDLIDISDEKGSDAE